MSILPKILKLFKSKKLLLSVVLVGVFVMASFAVVGVVDAAHKPGVPIHGEHSDQIESDGTTFTLSIFISGVVWVLNLLFGIIILIEGVIIAIFTALLKVVVGYNGFVESTAVQVGWTLVRDLTNLFFVVVLLIIAFGTILRQGDNYSIKKLLPKVLIMAVLVNFSLVIAGLLIDASQVVMLTFVAAFSESVGFNIFNTLGIPEATSAKNFEGIEPARLVSVFATNFLAILFLFISMVTIVVMTLIFIARIVALWILLVLAPLPYVLFAFPKLKQYAAMWWTEFTKYLIIGPVMAFFLWLAFAVVNQGGFSLFEDVSSSVVSSSIAGPEAEKSVNEFLKENSIFIDILEKTEFTKYVIAIAMLFAGMIAAQKAGVVGASMAGSVVNRARGIGTGLLKGAGRWSLRTIDEQQAKLGKRVLRPLGETRFGKFIGADIAAKEGIKVRDLPHAWRFRRERIERQRDARSKEATTDLLNRMVPSFSREETQERRKKYSEDIAVAKKRQRDASDDAEEIVADTIKYLKPGGQFKTGKQILVEANLHLLGEEHNTNEYVFEIGSIIPAFKDSIKEYVNNLEGKKVQEVNAVKPEDRAKQQETRDKQLEDIEGIRKEQKKRVTDYNDGLDDDKKYELNKEGTGVKYTAQNTIKLVDHIFADKDENERNRIIFDIGETGQKNADPQLKYGAVRNRETGNYERQTPEQQLEWAKGFAEKVPGRAWVQNYKYQNMLDEERMVDNFGNHSSAAFDLSDFGHQLHLQNSSALTAEWHLASNELKTKFTENADIFYEQMQKYASTPGMEDETQAMAGLLKNLIGFNIDGRNGEADTDQVFEAAQHARTEKRKKFKGIVDDKYTDELDEGKKIYIISDDEKKEAKRKKRKEKGDEGATDEPGGGGDDSGGAPRDQEGLPRGESLKDTTGRQRPEAVAPSSPSLRELTNQGPAIEGQIKTLQSAIDSNQNIAEALGLINDTLNSRLKDLQENDPSNTSIADILEAKDSVDSYRLNEGDSDSLTSQKAEKEIISLLRDIYNLEENDSRKS